MPRHRLDRAEIKAFFGSGGGSGSRAVASFDEDTTTMGYAAARSALDSCAGTALAQARGLSDLWFATSTPAYLDKTNAAAIHAALGLDVGVGALDFGGALRSGIGALRSALAGRQPILVVTADMRDGMPTSADEATASDGAAAILVGGAGNGDDRGADTADDGPGPGSAGTGGEVIAEFLGCGTATDEFMDRWRLPGSPRPNMSPERFGEAAYGPVLQAAWDAALADSGIEAGDVGRLLVAGMNARALQRNMRVFGAAAKQAAKPPDGPANDLAAGIADRVGNTGTAHPLLLLTAALESAAPDEIIAVVTAADGAEALILRTTSAIASHRPAAPLQAQIDDGKALAYGAFLSWRQMVTVAPPNRPPPSPPSAAAGYRRRHWKFGFVGSRDRSSEMVHLPPARVSERGGAVDDMAEAPMAATQGTIASFTVDRLAYSPSPPVVFAVVDFDGGGRAPLQLTDASADEVTVGGRVEPTFRRLFTADEVHNYFWKVRPVQTAAPTAPKKGTG